MEQQIQELHGRQEALERDSIESGRRRFMDRIKRAEEAGRGGSAGAGLLWLYQNTEAMIEAFEFQLAYSGKGRPSVLRKFAQDLDAETVGAVAMMVVANNLMSSTPKDAVGREIVDRLMAERRANVLRKEAPGLFSYKLRSFKGTMDYWHMARSLWASLRFSDVDTSALEMSDAQKAIVSTQILQVIENTLGDAIKSTLHQTKNRRTHYWQFSEGLLEEIRAKNAELCLTAAKPVHRPTLVPPRRWSKEDLGGYWYSLRGEVELVRKARKWQRKALEESDLSVLHNSLNALQETAWQINTRVLETINHLKSRGGDVAGLPSMEQLPMPKWPSVVPFETRGPHAKMTKVERDAIERSDNIDEIRKALGQWRAECNERHQREQERSSVAKSFLNTLDVAWDYEAEDRLYFVFNCDWRGRIYPVAEYLQPQGDDIARGLLRFAEGEALGDGYWLAVHGATCLDDSPEGVKLSKQSFDERAEWVEGHEAEILAVASDPYSNQWWQDADKPFQFLAFCFEWADYVASGRDPEFVGYLGVALDGSANAYQHYAGLWQDETCAASVNLTPTDRPVDVYQMVADRALDLMQSRFEAGEDLAGLWLSSGILDRKLAKVPTMSAVYGSRKSQWPQGIEARLRKDGKLEGAKAHFGDDDWYEARKLVSDVLFEAMNGLLPSAMKGRDYLRACARVAASENKPVSWTVPFTNFPVRQSTWKLKSKQVKTWLSGKLCYQQSYVVPTADLDRHAQQDGVAANFVHSHDAAHLALAVSELADQHGITSMHTVHDSFAVHPRHVEVLRTVLRDTFVRLHTEPILENLREGLAQTVDADLPEEVPAGSFDLGQVYVADYLFG